MIETHRNLLTLFGGLSTKMSDHFTSTDEDLEEFLDVLEVPKSINYFEEVVPQLTNAQYSAHFRVSRHVSQYLAERFGASEYNHHQEGDSIKVTPLKYILVFLWFSANESVSYRDVADRFAISHSTLFKIVRRVTIFLSNLSSEIIVWPTDEEKNEIEAWFRDRHFPGVIGVIDGTHIKIDKPAEDPDSYLNRKQFFSVQAQVVCDHKRRIRDIFVGFPGSVHDARVFRTSPLFTSLANKCAHFYILGDSAYPCLRHLLTPFKDNGQLSRRQQNYNLLLSKNRYVIEQCFGLLKQRFRQLYHIKLHDVSVIIHFIRACAVLHNLSVDDEFIPHEENIPAPQRLLNAGERDGGNEDDRDGVAKRNEVMNRLTFIL